MARGADLQGRGDGTLDLNYNQQSTASGAPQADGVTTGAPIQTQFTAHLTESVPDQHYAPAAPAPVVVAPAAPVINEQGGCFITTAICKATGLPDDCYELQLLRAFRDNYMQADDNRRADVELYYLMAEKISNKLNNEQLLYLRTEFLYKAIYQIEKGFNDLAYATYKDMFKTAVVFSEQN